MRFLSNTSIQIPLQRLHFQDIFKLGHARTRKRVAIHRGAVWLPSYTRIAADKSGTD